MKSFSLLLITSLVSIAPALADPQQARPLPTSPGQAASTPASDLSALEQESAALTKRIDQQRIYATMKIAQQKVKADPNDAKAHRTLAEHLGAEHGQFQNEMQERREAVRCDPNNPYDIMALASMERYVHREESLRLLTGVVNGSYDAEAKREAGQVLAGIQAHPRRLNAR